MKLVYLCFQYGGNEDNVETIREIALSLQKNSTGLLYIVPHLALGYMYNELNFEDGMTLCLELLAKCDMMVTFGDFSRSPGCEIEKQFCSETDIPIMDLAKEIADEPERTIGFK